MVFHDRARRRWSLPAFGPLEIVLTVALVAAPASGQDHAVRGRSCPRVGPFPKVDREGWARRETASRRDGYGRLLHTNRPYREVAGVQVTASTTSPSFLTERPVKGRSREQDRETRATCPHRDDHREFRRAPENGREGPGLIAGRLWARASCVGAGVPSRSPCAKGCAVIQATTSDGKNMPSSAGSKKKLALQSGAC